MLCKGYAKIIWHKKRYRPHILLLHLICLVIYAPIQKKTRNSCAKNRRICASDNIDKRCTLAKHVYDKGF